MRSPVVAKVWRARRAAPHRGAVQRVGQDSGHPALGAEHRGAGYPAPAAARGARRHSRRRPAGTRGAWSPRRATGSAPTPTRSRPAAPAPGGASRGCSAARRRGGKRRWPSGSWMYVAHSSSSGHAPGSMVSEAMSSFHSNERHTLPSRSNGNSGVVVAQEHDVVVAARARASAPLGAGVADERAGPVQLVDERHRRVPARLGDVEVVRGVAEHVEAGRRRARRSGCSGCRWSRRCRRSARAGRRSSCARARSPRPRSPRTYGRPLGARRGAGR